MQDVGELHENELLLMRDVGDGVKGRCVWGFGVVAGAAVGRGIWWGCVVRTVCVARAPFPMVVIVLYFCCFIANAGVFMNFGLQHGLWCSWWIQRGRVAN